MIHMTTMVWLIKTVGLRIKTYPSSSPKKNRIEYPPNSSIPKTVSIYILRCHICCAIVGVFLKIEMN